MEPLLNVGEAAKVLAVSIWTVRGHIRKGKLNAVHIGRLVRLESSEIERFIEGGKTAKGGVRKFVEVGIAE